MAIAGAAVATTFGVLGNSGAARADTPGLHLNLAWTVDISNRGKPIAQSSPTVATLEGHPSVVVGDRSGKVYAFEIDGGGTEVPGWPAGTGGVAVDSAPSTAGGEVFVGVGNAAKPSAGGYAAFSEGGRRIWERAARSLPGGSRPAGVDSGLAVGNLQGQTDVVSGSMGQLSDALKASNGAVLRGFPFFQADSNFATPAIAQLYGNGTTQIVEGGDSTAGLAYNVRYHNGGHVRVLTNTGRLSCSYNPNQVIQSSPAVGRFLASQGMGIAVGTGTYWPGASMTDRVVAVNTRCQPKWSTKLHGATTSSPALVDAFGTGGLEIAEGTNIANRSGVLYLLNGTNGHVIWQAPTMGAVMGGVVSADLGGGYQDLIVAATGGAEIFDGRTGRVLWSARLGAAYQNAPLVTDDPNGTIGITFAGYNGGGSRVSHLEVAGSDGAVANETGAWPMFHHDPQLTGFAEPQ